MRDEGPGGGKEFPGDRRGTHRRNARYRRRVAGRRGEPGGPEAPLPRPEGASPRVPVLRRITGTFQGDGVRVRAAARGGPRVPAGGGGLAGGGGGRGGWRGRRGGGGAAGGGAR